MWGNTAANSTLQNYPLEIFEKNTGTPASLNLTFQAPVSMECIQGWAKVGLIIIQINKTIINDNTRINLLFAHSCIYKDIGMEYIHFHNQV